MHGVTKDGHAGWHGKLGVSGARITSADASGADVDLTDAPGSAVQLVITDVLISVGTTMRVDLKEQTSGTVLASFYLAANTTQQFTPRAKLKLATGKKLLLRTSAAGNISVTPFYYPEAAVA